MAESLTPLAALRHEIDAVDDQIHDLIMRRAGIVSEIRKLKMTGGAVFRPAREAQILRRLAARHKGPFPLTALLHAWREMIGGYTSMQGRFLAMGPAELEPIAFAHFGHALSYQPSTSETAIQTVMGRTVMMAILPWPTENERWWTNLLSTDLSVVAALPFIDSCNPQAVVVGPIPLEQSDDDRTLVVLPAACQPPSDWRRLSASQTQILWQVPYTAKAEVWRAVDPDAQVLGIFPAPLMIQP